MVSMSFYQSRSLMISKPEILIEVRGAISTLSKLLEYSDGKLKREIGMKNVLEALNLTKCRLQRERSFSG